MPTKKPFDQCSHKWKFLIDADSSGGPGNKPWKSFYICEKCNHVITLSEKGTLDQIIAQNKSLKIQEKHTKISMCANVIAAITLIIAFLTFLFGNKIIELWS
jgi:hypothetical protein